MSSIFLLLIRFGYCIGHGHGYIDVVLVWLMLYALLMHWSLLELCSCQCMLFYGLQDVVYV